MTEVVTNPTEKDILHAREWFDSENAYCEGALTELFQRFPGNTSRDQVYLKTVALNALYSTQIPRHNDRIPALWEVADHIVGLMVDESLLSGSPELVDKIAEIIVPNKGRRYNYSFATKYCSWQRPDAYPIFDSRVNEYLWHLRNLGVISPFKRDLLWNYPEFKRIVNEFRVHFGLGSFTYKDTDKFLYREGGKILDSNLGEAPSAG